MATVQMNTGRTADMMGDQPQTVCVDGYPPDGVIK